MHFSVEVNLDENHCLKPHVKEFMETLTHAVNAFGNADGMIGRETDNVEPVVEQLAHILDDAYKMMMHMDDPINYMLGICANVQQVAVTAIRESSRFRAFGQQYIDEQNEVEYGAFYLDQDASEDMSRVNGALLYVIVALSNRYQWEHGITLTEDK